MHLSQPFAKDVFNGAAMAIDYIVYEMETPKDKQKKMEAVCVCVVLNADQPIYHNSNRSLSCVPVPPIIIFESFFYPTNI